MCGFCSMTCLWRTQYGQRGDLMVEEPGRLCLHQPGDQGQRGCDESHDRMNTDFAFVVFLPKPIV